MKAKDIKLKIKFWFITISIFLPIISHATSIMIPKTEKFPEYANFIAIGKFNKVGEDVYFIPTEILKSSVIAAPQYTVRDLDKTYVPVDPLELFDVANNEEQLFLGIVDSQNKIISPSAGILSVWPNCPPNNTKFTNLLDCKQFVLATLHAQTNQMQQPVKSTNLATTTSNSFSAATSYSETNSSAPNIKVAPLNTGDSNKAPNSVRTNNAVNNTSKQSGP